MTRVGVALSGAGHRASVSAAGPAPHSFRRGADVTEPPAIPGQMLLTDGGVYDNMADQWAAGLAARVRANAALDIKTKGLDELIVANASAGPPWTTVKASWLPAKVRPQGDVVT